VTTSTLVDTNIFIDLLGPASEHRVWSLEALATCLDQGPLVINPVIWSELASSPLSDVQLTSALGSLALKKETLSFEAAFAAGKAHRRYRLAGGLRERTLADFFIGAHAEVGRHRLLTRDAARYATYFPTVDLITPETHP
jgi:predicted nucleic acid-binding protein